MTQELRVTRDREDRSIDAPFIHAGGQWKQANTIYRRESGTWVEWWPLAPEAVTDITGVFLYRNDRIELDVDWTAAGSGPPAVEYLVTIRRAQSWPMLTSTQTGTSWTPDREWQSAAGQKVVITVTPYSGTGVEGASASTPEIVIPQLPAPPAPTAVDVTIDNRRATVLWAHTGGNRLTSFETWTKYKTPSNSKPATKNARSLDVTFWSTASVEGDPGGAVLSYVRAIGPGGSSAWVSDSATIPYVPTKPPPDPTPTPSAVIPGTVKFTEHRFYNGELIVDFSVSNASSVLVWYNREGAGLVSQGSTGTSGRFTVALSGNWARDEVSRYRIHMVGVSSTGHQGATTVGPYCRKLPNPYYVNPTGHVAVRGNAPYNDGLLRQGASYNEWDYLNPKIIWRSFAVYGTRMETAFAKSRIGYNVTVTKGQVLLWRTPTGGSGGAVRPRLHYHTYKTTGAVGHTLLGGHDVNPMARGQLGWQNMSLGYARQLVSSTGVKGVGIYHPNYVLNGQVSAEYMKFQGSGTAAFGVPCWTCSFYHDG